MSFLAIIFLIVLGIVLILVEFLVIPGVTVAGIGGAVLIAVGVYFSFRWYGNRVGSYTLLGTCVFILLAILISLRSGTWKKLMLNRDIDSKISKVVEADEIKPGDTGVTISRLAPIGKAMINGKIVEAKSEGGYIEEKTEISVLKILSNNILVKPKS